MKTRIITSLALGLLLGFVSCDTSDVPVEQAITKETLSGYVQKGPYINGSSVTISELDAGLNQTGRSYSTTVAGNSGSFEQKQIELITNYLQLKADGYYFNEVNGKSSSGQLTLYALADVAQVSSANVNVLTHLEKSRAEYLVQQKGLSFADAKTQAQNEVLAIFSLELPNNATSESLNLTKNGILLAVSCILQGQLSTAGMSELMANIISDIKTDGTLDDPSLGSQLIDNARLVNTAATRENLEAKYAEPSMGNVVIPDFESHVQLFMEKTAYEPKTFIKYPETGQKGINILAEGITVIIAYNGNSTQNNFYSMKAELPEGTSLKVILKGGMWHYVSLPNPINWTIGGYNEASHSQVFTVTQSNIANDLSIAVEAGEITVEYYENDATVPTRVKQLIAEEVILPPNDSTKIH
ncbi:hypothetical protein MASR2M47_41930 [Draconibacterium sp.]|jgi:hypothetical protein